MDRKKFLEALAIGGLTIGIAPAVFASAGNKKCDEEICRITWEKLCGKHGASGNEAFNYVHPVKRIPNVLLYGDSISIAYTQTVRENLTAKASVFRLHKNGGSSQNFIPNMNEMQETMFQPYLERGWDFEWDLIHFNVGLHDLKYLKDNKLDKENGKQVSSIDEYKVFLKEICEYLKLKYPKAKLVFATTTPVPANAEGRYEGDSIKYNKAALEILANYPNIAINDLYNFTFPHLEAWASAPGNVHYNELGYTGQEKK